MATRTLTLLANYAPSGQHSLRQYSDFVMDAATRSPWGTEVQFRRPVGLFSRLPTSVRKHRIWSDLDKYLIGGVELAQVRCDTLHILDNSNAWYALLARHRRLVVTCHDMLPWLCATGRVHGWHLPWYAKMLLFWNSVALKQADLVVSVSNKTTEDLVNFGIKKERIRTISNCVFQDFPSSSDGTRFSGIDVSEVFFHLGAGKFPKNTEFVVSAFSQFLATGGSGRLLLVGQAPALSGDIPSDRITSYSYLTPSELKFLYLNSRGLLMPSRYEGFGLPVLEAQLAGCPVISSDEGALDEVQGSYPLKFSIPAQSDAFVAAMHRLTIDRSFREFVISAGFQNAARYSRQRTLEAYVGLYSELSGQP